MTRTTLVALALWSSAAAGAGLSYFQPSGKQCHWNRAARPIRREAAVVARFNAACAGLSVAWNLERTKALLHFSEPLQLIEVATASYQQRVLELPPGQLREAGYDTQGSILALTTQDFEREVVFEGKRYVQGNHIGAPALAHAWELEGGQWRRLETEVTGVDACLAPGTGALPASERMLRPRSVEQVAVTAAERERLSTIGPLLDEKNGEWRRSGEVFAWYEQFGEYLRPTGVMAMMHQHRFRLLETGFTSADPVQLSLSDRTALVTSQAAARVIDLRTGKALFSEHDVYAVELR